MPHESEASLSAGEGLHATAHQGAPYAPDDRTPSPADAGLVRCDAARRSIVRRAAATSRRASARWRVAWRLLIVGGLPGERSACRARRTIDFGHVVHERERMP